MSEWGASQHWQHTSLRLTQPWGVFRACGVVVLCSPPPCCVVSHFIHSGVCFETTKSYLVNIWRTSLLCCKLSSLFLCVSRMLHTKEMLTRCQTSLFLFLSLNSFITSTIMTKPFFFFSSLFGFTLLYCFYCLSVVARRFTLAWLHACSAVFPLARSLLSHVFFLLHL